MLGRAVPRTTVDQNTTSIVHDTSAVIGEQQGNHALTPELYVLSLTGVPKNNTGTT